MMSRKDPAQAQLQKSVRGDRTSELYKKIQDDDDGGVILKIVTDFYLKKLVDSSKFFPANPPPRDLPSFHFSEVQLGTVLGQGEFGRVYAVASFLLNEDTHGLDQTKYEGSEATLSQGDNRDKHRAQESDIGAESFSSLATVNLKLGNLAKATSSNTAATCDNEESTHERNQMPVSGYDTDENDEELLAKFKEAIKNFPHKHAKYHDHDYDSDDEVFGKLNDEDPSGIQVKLRMAMITKRNGYSRYAVKRIRDDLLDNPQWKIEAVSDLACEAKFLQSLKHPNIVRMRGTMGEHGTPDFGLILDCLKEILSDKLVVWKKSLQKAKGTFGLIGRNVPQQRKLFSEQLLAVYDIARGLKFLHSKKIIYRDLKPENIGFSVRGEVRIFDFGVAKELKAQDLIDPPFGYNATGLTGTRRYMAPEVLLSAPYGPPADVFSFTILAWQMLSLKRPFPSLDNEEHTKHVAIQGKRPSLLSCFSNLLRDILTQGWAQDPMLRPSFQDICSTLKVEIVKTSDLSSSILDRTKHLTERSIKSFYCRRGSRSEN